jgi:hypothetical protein
MMYDKHARGMDISYGQIIHEMERADSEPFRHGQGAADLMMRRISPTRAAGKNGSTTSTR